MTLQGDESMDRNSSIKELIDIDLEKEVERIIEWIRGSIFADQRRKGVVLGLSGGIDSTICTYLAERAIGKERVLCIKMPEKESDTISSDLADVVINDLGVNSMTEDITAILEGAKAYERRDDAIRRIIPEYGEGWSSKIILEPPESGKNFNISYLVTRSPDGKMEKHRPGYKEYFDIVSASNFKQRARKMIEYHHADRLNYSVIGTPNRLEYQLGFFVKNGDGAADIKPIAHLYKTQVYAIGSYLGVPEEILKRVPTTDTYSLPQTQEEFYFSLPYKEMDIALAAYNKGLPSNELALILDVSEKNGEAIYQDIESKIKATRYLHMSPELLK